MWEQANVCMIDTYIDNLIYDKVDNEEMLVFSIKDAKSIGYLSMRKKMKQSPPHTEKHSMDYRYECKH